MPSNRSTTNVALLIIYILLYLTAPAVFLFIGMDKVEMHGFFSITYAFAGIGILFFFVSGLVLILKYFPKSNSRSLLILLPIIVNNLLYFLFNSFNDFLIIFILNSTIVFSSLVFSISLATFLIPWEIEKSSKRKGNPTKYSALKNNLRYVRKNPILWISLAVLLLPIMAAIHFFSMGIILLFSHSLLLESIASFVLYMFAFANVSIFHIREAMKHFSTTD